MAPGGAGLDLKKQGEWGAESDLKQQVGGEGRGVGLDPKQGG